MIKDPRDKYFYHVLQKKDQSQLTQKEIEEYLGYCEKMIPYVVNGRARKQWISLKKTLLEKLNQIPQTVSREAGNI